MWQWQELHGGRENRTAHQLAVVGSKSWSFISDSVRGNISETQNTFTQPAITAIMLFSPVVLLALASDLCPPATSMKPT